MMLSGFHPRNKFSKIPVSAKTSKSKSYARLKLASKMKKASNKYRNKPSLQQKYLLKDDSDKSF